MAKIGINIATGSLQQQEIIVGIDLGTTNSLIAVIHPESERPVVLKEYDGNALVPSLLHFGREGNINVGDKAKGFLLLEPERTLFSIKRLMGKSYKDLDKTVSFLSYKIIDDNTDSLVKVQVGDLFYTPVELSSYVLKELKSRAEHILKTPVNKAVITVPAYFNDTQRQATKDAGKLAGLDVLRIINEPTAASLAYGIGLDPNETKTVAVYDLGGGTFDVSILRLQQGVYEVLATNGNTYLGGDDFDRVIVNHWIKELQIDPSVLADNKVLLQELRLLAEKAKVQLSQKEIFESSVANKPIKISRVVFEELISSFVEETIQSCRNALLDAGLRVNDIDEVVMVGGSTRVPLVKEMVKSFFQQEVNDSLNPDEVVALGAAIQADVLAGNNKEVLLLDVTPLSLGIETMGGLMDTLIPRNSKIPVKVARQYTTQRDGQGSMRITVCQGERDMVKDNRKLAEFTLAGIPGMPAGLPKVEISFLIDADGILTVKAKELRSGVEQSIEVKPQYGLTDTEVENMLLDSITHAREDMQARSLAEAIAEGEQLIVTTENFMNKNEGFLTEQENQQTVQAIDVLRKEMQGSDKNSIHTAIEQLNEVSRPYAERLMDEAISVAMKGRKV